MWFAEILRASLRQTSDVEKPRIGAGAGWAATADGCRRLCVAAALVLLVVVADWSRARAQEDPPDPSALCRRSPERPECVLFLEKQRSLETSEPTPRPAKRHERQHPPPTAPPTPHPTTLPTPTLQPTPQPTPPPTPTLQPTPPPTPTLRPTLRLTPTPAPVADLDACTTTGTASSGGSTGKPGKICPCQKALGTIKGYLRNADTRSDPNLVIEICETATDYRLDGALVIAKEESHPSFAQAALDDVRAIASISDPSGHVGFEFLVELVRTLTSGALPAEERGVVVRWGALPIRGESGKVGPVTRPGTSERQPTSGQWQAATAQGLDVYARDGAPVGGSKLLFGGLLKGTGTGIGSSIYYEPETLPDPKTCPSGLTSDIALLHELQHAARMALGQVDNTPYSNLWLNRDPLGALYGVHEERFIVERENEYREALRRQAPNRYPKLQPRKSFLTDC
jgi:hypothetical protein